MTSLDPFFDEAEEQSIVKTHIVTKYFLAWTQVMKPWVMKNRFPKLSYLDFFSGPGMYKDGTKSTPIIILEMVLQDPTLREILAAEFNDKNPENAKDLNSAINAIPNISTLKYTPKVYNEEVSTSMTARFQRSNYRTPTLSFIDPWGYKGLTLPLIEAMLKNWGCDCIFFFNYNRANMAFNNDAVIHHMKALFGHQRAELLRTKLNSLNPSEREATILEALSQALKGTGDEPRYVLPFRFRNETGARISHHLIFVSKGFLGYEIMKDIMAGESSDRTQGVPSFEYNPATQLQPLLFDLTRSTDDLGEDLLRKFEGKTRTRAQIYEEHSVGTPFIKRNYIDVLLQLEKQQRIQVSPTKRRANTFGKDVVVTFPSIEPKP